MGGVYRDADRREAEGEAEGEDEPEQTRSKVSSNGLRDEMKSCTFRYCTAWLRPVAPAEVIKGASAAEKGGTIFDTNSISIGGGTLLGRGPKVLRKNIAGALTRASLAQRTTRDC